MGEEARVTAEALYRAYQDGKITESRMRDWLAELDPRTHTAPIPDRDRGIFQMPPPQFYDPVREPMARMRDNHPRKATITFTMEDGTTFQESGYVERVERELGGGYDYGGDFGGGRETMTVVLVPERHVPPIGRGTRCRSTPQTTKADKAKKEPTVAKHKITAINNRVTKSLDIYVEVLKDGKSQDPEVYAVKDRELMTVSTGERAPGEPMPVYESLDRDFAQAYSVAIRTELERGV